MGYEKQLAFEKYRLRFETKKKYKETKFRKLFESS